MISTILSGLALLVVIADLILTVQAKKRETKRNAALDAWKQAMVDYVDSEIRHATEKYTDLVNEYKKKTDNSVVRINQCLEDLSENTDEFAKKSEQESAAFLDALGSIRDKVADLEHGVVPDYNEALAAKNSVDEFNKGLSAIMGFDPVAAYRKQAEQAKYGGGVEE